MAVAAMQKGPASDDVMKPDKMKPLLALSKREPVNAAIALTADGEGLILLDKKARPRKVMAMLMADAAKAKLKLNTSSLRFGRAEVDIDYDPTMVRFFINKDAPGSMRMKLVEVVKRIPYQKVELNVDETLEAEADDETGDEKAGDETTGGQKIGEAAPPAPPPNPADLLRELGALAQRIQALPASDAAHKAELAHLAATANAAIKAGTLVEAAAQLSLLRDGLQATPVPAEHHLEPQLDEPAPAQVGEKLLPVWIEAKEKADEGVAVLQAAFRDSGRSGLRMIADYGLAGLTDKQGVAMMVALRNLDSNPASPTGRAKALTAVASYRSFLADNAPLFDVLESDDFGVSVDLRGPLTAALDDIEKRLGASQA